jgi:hypothetical protein
MLNVQKEGYQKEHWYYRVPQKDKDRECIEDAMLLVF